MNRVRHKRAAPQPYYQDKYVTIYHGDNRVILSRLELECTAVVTDPPYALTAQGAQEQGHPSWGSKTKQDRRSKKAGGFMGREWDSELPSERAWRIIKDSCLPGAALFSFGGTRTFHRLICAIEDAGWQIRDCLGFLYSPIVWNYATGFPKSHNISKSVDSELGAEREKVRIPADRARNPKAIRGGHGVQGGDCPWMRQAQEAGFHEKDGDIPVTPQAKLFAGYGTGMAPSYEPICLAMKPLEGTFAQNALEHGVAGLNIDGGRIPHNEECKMMAAQTNKEAMSGHGKVQQGGRHKSVLELKPEGRWPKNLILDGSEEVVRCFPNTATRMFFCAKASPAERNKGCRDLPLEVSGGMSGTADQSLKTGSGNERNNMAYNTHPTVKPLALLRYLVTLVTMPEKNLILDPFCGSGTTGVACKELGLSCILIDSDEHSCEIAAARVKAAKRRLKGFQI